MTIRGVCPANTDEDFPIPISLPDTEDFTLEMGGLHTLSVERATDRDLVALLSRLKAPELRTIKVSLKGPPLAPRPEPDNFAIPPLHQVRNVTVEFDMVMSHKHDVKPYLTLFSDATSLELTFNYILESKYECPDVEAQLQLFENPFAMRQLLELTVNVVWIHRPPLAFRFRIPAPAALPTPGGSEDNTGLGLRKLLFSVAQHRSNGNDGNFSQLKTQLFTRTMKGGTEFKVLTIPEVVPVEEMDGEHLVL